MSGNIREESTWERLKNHLPVLSKTVAIILLVFNIFIPGLGTACLCCIGGDFKVEHLGIGLLQFLLSVCIIGWLWSITWGIILLIKSKD